MQICEVHHLKHH